MNNNNNNSFCCCLLASDNLISMNPKTRKQNLNKCRVNEGCEQIMLYKHKKRVKMLIQFTTEFDINSENI